VEAEFVGHPLAELPLPAVSREQFADENGLDPDTTWIALLPGSRPREIRGNLPEMLEAAWTLIERPQPGGREYRFLLPLAPTLNAGQREEVKALLDEHGDGLPILVVEDARAALYHARVSVVASGTATVEAALIGNPFVVVYRVSPLTYAIARRVVTVPHVAMANLIAGKRVVPELIQNDFTAAKIVQQIERLLPDGAPRESMMKELKAVGSSLRSRREGMAGENRGAVERVAAVTLELLGTPASLSASSAVHS
jgi:lipid-A-disaccharide synthase